ncbi:transcriptional regulator, LysR family [Paracoccus aminovorans]|uniref:Transcriptional regulator, LysR family n=1 Tax=Paracoccus aminovorans TaxID=34004 RepID=A0A1I3ENR6_9RHOB|nr:LysR family transcriptional regulator [Paracoccus aminovorans]CQR86997.1 LysR family transcriptional regulator [Paracoccus aminovorans]SFI00538.1 transcriptional regulator, LysR family [Paracoccus aminovorans]
MEEETQDTEGPFFPPVFTKIPFDLSALQYVVAAADYGSFRRAAEALGQYPATVSRGVQRIEDVVGVSFFERCSSGIRLTDAGVQFVAAVRPAIDQIMRATQTAGAAGRGEYGRLSIGVLTSLAGGFLRELIEQYTLSHPKVAIEVRDGGRAEHIAALRSRQLDIAFFTGNGAIADCETAELWREQVHVAFSADHHLAERESIEWSWLRDQKFLVTKCAPGLEVHDYIVRRLADYSTYPAFEIMPCNQETLMNMVAIGRGITVVSAGWSFVSVPRLVLRPLVADEDTVPFSAVWAPGRDNPSLRRFLSLASKLASKDPGERLRRLI